MLFGTAAKAGPVCLRGRTETREAQETRPGEQDRAREIARTRSRLGNPTGMGQDAERKENTDGILAVDGNKSDAASGGSLPVGKDGRRRIEHEGRTQWVWKGGQGHVRQRWQADLPQAPRNWETRQGLVPSLGEGLQILAQANSAGKKQAHRERKRQGGSFGAQRDGRKKSERRLGSEWARKEKGWERPRGRLSRMDVGRVPAGEMFIQT